MRTCFTFSRAVFNLCCYVYVLGILIFLSLSPHTNYRLIDCKLRLFQSKVVHTWPKGDRVGGNSIVSCELYMTSNFYSSRIPKHVLWYIRVCYVKSATGKQKRKDAAFILLFQKILLLLSEPRNYWRVCFFDLYKIIFFSKLFEIGFPSNLWSCSDRPTLWKIMVTSLETLIAHRRKKSNELLEVCHISSNHIDFF